MAFSPASVSPDAQETVQNKTLDSTNALADSSDSTKTLAWDLSSASSGKSVTLASNHTDDRTVTLPDADDTLVARDTSETLTNKTISGASNTLTVRVADLSTGTDGELITWDASGNPTTVAVGTSGQVLTSNGAGAAPTFQAAAGGGSTVERTLLTLSGDDSAMSVGDPITWDTQSGDKTDYTIATGKITLPSGGTYILECWPHVNHASATYTEMRWYDVTNTTYIGIKQGAYAPTYNSNTAASTNAVAFVDTSGGAVDVECRVEAKGGTTNMRSNGTKGLITRLT